MGAAWGPTQHDEIFECDALRGQQPADCSACMGLTTMVQVMRGCQTALLLLRMHVDHGHAMQGSPSFTAG
jgi:hypothetical protein